MSHDHQDDEADLLTALQSVHMPTEESPLRTVPSTGIVHGTRPTPEKELVEMSVFTKLKNDLLKRIGKLENQIDDLTSQVDDLLRKQNRSGKNQEDGEAEGLQSLHAAPGIASTGMAEESGQASSGEASSARPRAIPLRDL